MEKIKDKKELYTLINKKSKDNLNIVAYLSRNSKGELLDVEVEDSFYHDIFILEGVATSQSDGVQKELTNKPDFSDFWVLNTSNFPVYIESKDGAFKKMLLEPNNLKLIQAQGEVDYNKVCFSFGGVSKCAVCLPLAKA